MSEAGLALQKALYAALSASNAASLVSGIFDGPPVGAVFPYITIGPDLVSDASTKTETRREHRLAVTVWAATGAVSAVKPVMAAVEAAVLAMPKMLGGYRLVTSDFLRSFTRADPAGGLVSGTCEFRARTEPV